MNEKTDLMRLDRDAMRQLGYAAVDLVVDRFDAQSEGPVVPWIPPGDRPDLALSQFGKQGRDSSEVLEEVIQKVMPNCMNLLHPRFFAYIPGPSNFVSAVGDFLASGFNVFAGVSTHNHGAYQVEDSVIQWLCGLVGLGEDASGLLVSGGSAASLTALIAGRKALLDDTNEGAVAYYTDQTHSSVGRALNILGFKDSQLRVLPCDENLRAIPAAFDSAIQQDIEAGLKPFLIVGNAGTTNSGAVDPLDSLADLQDRYGLWFHVDGAYGGGAMLSDEVRQQFDGIQRADSVAIDPHKWLFQPYECAAVLTRHKAVLHDTFKRVPDYMKDTDAGLDVPNYRDMSIQVTRAFKALKLWMSLQVFGVDMFTQSVDAGLSLAREAERMIGLRKNMEVVTPATLGVVTLRYAPPGYSDERCDQINDELCAAVSADGFAFVSSTTLFGRRVLRLCPIHPNATPADITETLNRVEACATRIL